MANQDSVAQPVIEIIVRSPGRALDEIVLACLGLTWNQVFFTIDRLSRQGALKLVSKGRGFYTVYLSGNA